MWSRGCQPLRTFFIDVDKVNAAIGETKIHKLSDVDACLNALAECKGTSGTATSATPPGRTSGRLHTGETCCTPGLIQHGACDEFHKRQCDNKALQRSEFHPECKYAVIGNGTGSREHADEPISEVDACCDEAEVSLAVHGHEEAKVSIDGDDHDFERLKFKVSGSNSDVALRNGCDRNWYTRVVVSTITCQSFMDYWKDRCNDPWQK